MASSSVIGPFLPEGVTARLEQWERFHSSLRGRIYGDVQRRFEDGERVVTSAIADDAELAEGALVTTRNSVYLLGRPA